MAINKKCPKCGSTKVQLSSERSKHGFLWLLLFGIFYVCWWLMKATCAIMVLICWDWWQQIIHRDSGYVWVSKRMVQNSSKVYYCHDCGKNFRG